MGFLKKATSELGSAVVESSDPTMILTESKSRVSSVHHQERQKTGGRELLYLFFLMPSTGVFWRQSQSKGLKPLPNLRFGDSKLGEV